MTLFVIIAFIALVIPGVYITLNGNKSKQAKEAQKTKLYKKLYTFFSNFFVTQNYIATIYSKLANLSIYRKSELQALSIKYLLTSWGAAGGLMVLSFFVFNDFLTVLICLMFAIMLSNIVVDKQLDAMQYKVLKALANLLGSIRQEYMRFGSVVEALNEAQASALVKRPLEEICQILSSTNAELKLQEFCEATPFRTIQTLAGICYHINNQGDEVDERGQSNFIQALTLMLGDVNSEIQKTMYRKKKFGFIEYLPFIPIVGMGVMETYFISIMPGTALIYNGPLGYLCRTITVVTAIIAYTVVSRINCSIPIKEDDRGNMVLSLLEKPKFRRFINNITPKNTARRRLDQRLKNAISRMTIDQFYTKKVIGFVLALSLAVLCAVSTISLGREFIQTSTQQLSLVATKEMSEASKTAVRNLDADYLANPDSFNDTQVHDMIGAAIPGLSDLQMQDQVKRLHDKRKSLDNAYFKWWYTILCFCVGFIGWYAPNIMLKVRTKLIETEEEDDFLQLQTLVSILMNTNIDTLDMLQQLSQHSRVHRDMFLYAYQGYPSNPELELTRLQSKTPLMEFKRFIDKLRLSISDLSLKEAYSDLLIEREHILRIRDMTITSSIDSKRGFCGPLSMAPLAAMIIGEFLIPIGILGYNEFMNALNSM
jgi:hypothetical protein